MSSPQNTFLTQKRNRLSSSVTDSFQLLSTEEFIDINETKIPSIPFISFTDFNFDFQPSSKIIVAKKKPQTPKPSQQLITNENAMIKHISPRIDIHSLDEIPVNSLIKKYPQKKLNVVLDIDQTLIYSKDLEKFNDVTRQFITNDSHQIKVTVHSKKYEFVLNLRNHLKIFLESISKFATFYICTLSHEIYAKEIINILRQIADIEIRDENIVAVGAASNYKSFSKSISLFKNITNINNTIILDDTASVWVDSDLPNLILSKKYFSFKDVDIIPFQYIGTNNILLSRGCFYEDEKNTLPIYVENEYSSKMQLKYIESFIERAFKLSLIRNEEVLDSMRLLRRKVLMKCNINLDYYSYSKEMNLVKELIKYLGGNDNGDNSSITHFIVSSENKKLTQYFNRNNNIRLFGNKIAYYVNIKWLFHCYFYLQRMDESADEYRMW